MKASRSVALAAVMTGFIAASQLAFPATSHAVTIYTASPGGAGTTCSTAAPCGLKTALSQAPAGATIQLEPGSYRSPSTAYTDTLSDSNGSVTIEGQPGKARPVIFTNAGYGIELKASTLRDVKIVSSAKKPSGPVILLSPLTAVVGNDGSTISHVVVFAEAQDEAACAVDGVVVDSLCVADGKGGVGLYEANAPLTQNDSHALTLRGSTIIGRGPKTRGMSVSASDSGDTNTIGVTNSIIRGISGSVVAGSAGSGATTTVTLSYSDFGVVTKDQTSGTTSVTWNHRVSAQPVFVNEAHGEFGEAATSPTINAGTTDPSGDVDLARSPRTLGSAPDIGAYEFRQPPSKPTLTVTKKTKHSLHLSVSVNGEGLTTAVAAVAKHGHTKVPSSSKTATGNATSTVKLTVHGLKPHKSYHLHALATSAAGHVSSAHVKAKTK